MPVPRLRDAVADVLYRLAEAIQPDRQRSAPVAGSRDDLGPLDPPAHWLALFGTDQVSTAHVVAARGDAPAGSGVGEGQPGPSDSPAPKVASSRRARRPSSGQPVAFPQRHTRPGWAPRWSDRVTAYPSTAPPVSRPTSSSSVEPGLRREPADSERPPSTGRPADAHQGVSSWGRSISPAGEAAPTPPRRSGHSQAATSAPDPGSAAVASFDRTHRQAPARHGPMDPLESGAVRRERTPGWGVPSRQAPVDRWASPAFDAAPPVAAPTTEPHQGTIEGPWPELPPEDISPAWATLLDDDYRDRLAAEYRQL
jgi:hypothetical protein